METEGNLLQKMKNVFSDNEDKEKIAEEIIEKVLEGYEKGVLTRREMKMITNIFEYMDSDAKDIMTHRKNIVALDGEESLEKHLPLCWRRTNPDSRFMKKILTTLWGFFISGMRCRATWTVRQGKNQCMI